MIGSVSRLWTYIITSQIALDVSVDQNPSVIYCDGKESNEKYVLKMYFSKGKKYWLLVRIQPCTCNHSPGESEMGAWVQG